MSERLPEAVDMTKRDGSRNNLAGINQIAIDTKAATAVYTK